jgi:hypothetical protein
MTVRLDDRWSYAGEPVIRIENAALVVDLAPSMGGKILHLVDKVADRNVLWRHPHALPRPGPLGSNVDDYYAGGWDDAFPTGLPSKNRYGDDLPALGEVWNLPLSARIEEGGGRRARVVLEGYTPITPARWLRTVTVEADEPIVRLDTRIENVGARAFDFSWGVHPALAVGPGFRVDVPARVGRVDDADGGPLGTVGERFGYPLLRAGGQGELDVRRVLPARTGSYALYILEELRDGWVAATDVASRRGFGLVFDREVHRAVWQWTSYGGFRGWYHVIVEPWTAGVQRLDEAVAAGQARTLEPGQAFGASFLGIVYGGVEGVSRLGPDGSVAAGDSDLRTT